MKKTLLAFVAMLLCPFLSACTSTTTSSATSSNGVVTSTCVFEGAPYTIHIGESMDLPAPTITPEEYQDKWYLRVSSNTSVLSFYPNNGVTKVFGIMAGEASLNYKCKVKGADGEYPTAQADYKVIDPVSESASVSSLLSTSSTKAGSFYTINAILEGSIEGNPYGSAYLTDPSTKEQIKIAHSSETDLFKYTNESSSISFNYKDERCVTSSKFVSGDLVTFFAQLQFDNGVPYVDGYFQKKETNNTEPSIVIKDGDNISLSKSSNLVWGETIVATITTASNKTIKNLIIDRGYARDNAKQTSTNVFSFTLTTINNLSLEYVEPGTTPIVQVYFTWFMKDNYSAPFTSTTLNDEVMSHLSTSEKEYFGGISDVVYCYPGAKGLWLHSDPNKQATFSISVTTSLAIRASVSALRYQPSDTTNIQINNSSYMPTSATVETLFDIPSTSGHSLTSLSFSIPTKASMYIHSITFYK
jgi:hypothetical protein